MKAILISEIFLKGNKSFFNTKEFKRLNIVKERIIIFRLKVSILTEVSEERLRFLKDPFIWSKIPETELIRKRFIGYIENSSLKKKSSIMNQNLKK